MVGLEKFASQDALHQSLKLEIGEGEFVSHNKIVEAQAVVESLDFSQMNSKLENYYGWRKEDVILMNDYYKKWLVVHCCYPSLAAAPSEKLDEYWHTHILDTKKYIEDCQLVFGYYLHHYPYFGLNGDDEDLESGFELTRKLFKHHFGHDLIGNANPCKSTSCR